MGVAVAAKVPAPRVIFFSPAVVTLATGVAIVGLSVITGTAEHKKEKRSQ